MTTTRRRLSPTPPMPPAHAPRDRPRHLQGLSVTCPPATCGPASAPSAIRACHVAHRRAPWHGGMVRLTSFIPDAFLLFCSLSARLPSIFLALARRRRRPPSSPPVISSFLGVCYHHCSSKLSAMHSVQAHASRTGHQPHTRQQLLELNYGGVYHCLV